MRKTVKKQIRKFRAIIGVFMRPVALTVLMLVMVPAFAFAGNYAITVVGSNGTVTGNPLSGSFTTATRVFTVTANSGYTLDHVQRLMPAPSTDVTAADITGSGPWTFTITQLAAAQSFQVSFKKATTTPLVLLASAPTTLPVVANTAATLSGATTTISYLAPGTQVHFVWSGPAGMTFNPASGNVTTPAGITTQVTASAGGTATLTLTAPGNTLAAGDVLTATTNIVVQPVGVVASQACLQCHSGSAEANAYALSPHAGTTTATCQACHNPGLLLQHPGTPLASMGNTECISCHTGNPTGHPIDIGSNVCISCHNPHTLVATVASILGAPHYNNMTGAGYPASYVTSRATCADCHTEGAANYNIRQQWKVSGHGLTTDLPWKELDFKTMPVCVKCHTTTGFIAYSTGKVTAAWGVAADKTKEVLRCNGCHKDVPNGIVRTVTPIKPYADETTYTNRNVRESNICMDCHSGLNNGKSISVKVGTANFNSLPFIPPHYLTAGGTLHGKTGYSFGQTYNFYSSNSHRLAGMGNIMGTGTAGPCVACHKNTNGHTFKAEVVAVCANCHTNSSLDATVLSADQTAFANALDALKAELAIKGFVYSDNYPYFNYSVWGTDQAGANTMGAAFNYVLLLKEPGAYAHNSAYAQKLLFDSIDYLYNGTITGNIDSALKDLVDNHGFDSAKAGTIQTHRDANGCTSCHTNTTGSHTKHLSSVEGGNAIGCVDCHSATAASNTSLIPGTVKHLNGVNDVIFAAGGSYVAGTCSVYCHSNGNGTKQSPTWGSGTSNCNFCHPLASLGGAHAAHIGSLIPTTYGVTANNSTTSEYRFGCGSCHPTAAANHGDGHVDVTLIPTADGTLRSKNDPGVVTSGIGNTGSGITGTSGSSVVCSAAYCHSNGGVGAALAYVASPDWYNAAAYTGDKCAMCHGNAPASGAHAKHAVSIHSGLVSSAAGGLIRAAAPAGTIASHGDPAQATTIGCITCHSATVTNSGNNQGTLCASCHVTIDKGTPVLDKTVHLNGTVDVLFKDVQIKTKAQIRTSSFDKYSGVWTRSSYKVDAGSFDTAKLSLAAAAFNPDKSCANVACHNGGIPKWNATLSCIDCHSRL